MCSTVLSYENRRNKRHTNWYNNKVTNQLQKGTKCLVLKNKWFKEVVSYHTVRNYCHSLVDRQHIHHYIPLVLTIPRHTQTQRNFKHLIKFFCDVHDRMYIDNILLVSHIKTNTNEVNPEIQMLSILTLFPDIILQREIIVNTQVCTCTCSESTTCSREITVDYINIFKH